MSPDAYCAAKAAPSASSLYYATRGLDAARARAVVAVHAFCRELHDVALEVADPAVARLKLGWWRTEVAAAFEARAQHPVTQALAPAIAAFRLAPDDFQSIVDGATMDLERATYPDFTALEDYCQRTAGSVWMLASVICGYAIPATRECAGAFGVALRLTSIVRDLGRDVRRGRLYLPQDELARFGVGSEALLNRQRSPGFAELMGHQVARTRRLYARARSSLPEVDRRAQRPARIMAAIGEALLAEIERDGFRVLDERVMLTPLAKAWIAWRTAWTR
jgi:phytoene synthase